MRESFREGGPRDWHLPVQRSNARTRLTPNNAARRGRNARENLRNIAFSAPPTAVTVQVFGNDFSGSSALCAKNGKRIAGPPVQSSLNPA